MITGIFVPGCSFASLSRFGSMYVAAVLVLPPLLAVATSGIPSRKTAATVNTSPRPPLPQRALERDSPPRLPVPQSALERLSPRVPPLFLVMCFLLQSALCGAGRIATGARPSACSRVKPGGTYVAARLVSSPDGGSNGRPRAENHPFG